MAAILTATFYIKEAKKVDFSKALEALKVGKKVCRGGWDDRGTWLVLISRDAYQVGSFFDRLQAGIEQLPWIGMKTADNKFVPWLASQTDILAEDWCIVVSDPTAKAGGLR